MDAIPIDALAGVSPTARLTVRSAPGADAVIERASTVATSDYVVRVRGQRLVTFEDLTIRVLGNAYTRGVWLLPFGVGNAAVPLEGVVFRGVRFEAPNVFSSSNYSSAIYAQGARGLRVEGSTFVDSRIVLIPSDDAVAPIPTEDAVVVGNTFDQTGLLPRAAVNATETVGLRVEGNHIDQRYGGTLCDTIYGLFVAPQDGAHAIERNTIVTQGIGLFFAEPEGGPLDAGTSVLAANNAVTQVETACRPAVQVGVPTAALAHNTVLAHGPDPAVDITPEASGGVDFRHNVVVATAAPALAVDAAAVLTETGPNALWSDGATLATWHGTAAADLAALQAASGGFAGSVEVRPAFADEASGDLRLAAYSAALEVAPLAFVPVDIDSTARTAPTLMGISHLSIPNVAVGVRALLQGAYPTAPTADGTPDPMRTALAGAGAIPLDHPYDDAAFDGLPAECDAPGVASGVIAADVVDWVVVALRADASGPDLACLPALLRDDGVVLGADGTPGLTFAAMEAGDYHVVVYHRNHLAAMAAAPAALSDVSTNVDLAGAGHYGGGALLVEPGLRALRAGDGDGDGSILAPDQQSVWLPTVGQAGYFPGDFNLDGSVLANDQQVFWLPNVGQQSTVPGASSLTSGEPDTARRAPEARQRSE